ncbi:MAG: glycoside hydrolase family 2 protein [Anaerolineae bacterium]
MDGSASHREAISLNGWWHTHYDDGADWRSESPFLPGTPLSALPTHAPTLGWRHVEEHMESLQVPGTWSSSRPGFHGVVWQWRPLVLPAHLAGRRLRLCFEAVRLQAEVYLDRRLVACDLDGHTPFEVELTGCMCPEHRHELAVRVTNPGGAGIGEPDQVLSWGDLRLPADHDFGGQWGDVALVATPPAYLAELLAFPEDDLRGLRVRVRVDNAGSARSGRLRLAARDVTGHVVAAWEGDLRLSVGVSCQDMQLAIPVPRLWSPEDPHLYTVRAELEADGLTDALEISCGLRSFRVLGESLALNGEPFVPIAARTSGWYPENLAFPSRALARREVEAAKALGLNTLVTEEQEAGPRLLEAADAAGLLVFQTLSGFWTRSGDAPNAQGRRVLENRLRRLMRRDANHPSVVCWHLPDDAGLHAVAAAEDPTRLRSAVSLDSTGSGCRRACAIEVGGQVVLRYAVRAPWLPDLPALVQSYGDRVFLPGSDGARWRAWQQALESDGARYGLSAAFDDPGAFYLATQFLAVEEMASAVAAQRMEAPQMGVLVGPWALDGGEGACGLVDVRRVALAGELGRAHPFREGVLPAQAPWPRLVVDRGPVVEVDTAVLDPQNVLQPLRPRWGKGWRDYTEGQSQASLLLCSWPGVQAEGVLRAAGEAGARVVWLLPDLDPRQCVAVCELLVGVARAQGPVSRVPLHTPPWGSWLWGYAHPLLDGVADPGLWGRSQAELRPRWALRGLDGETIAAGCSLPGPQEPLGAPRMGTTLGRLSLGRGALLLCTLPIVSGAAAGLPTAERLLGHVLRWLSGEL